MKTNHRFDRLGGLNQTDADPTRSSLDNPLLLEAVEEYLAELESGRPIDQEQFLARYPQIARELSAALQGLALVKQGVAHVSAAAKTEGDEHVGLTAKPLGDFRLLREIGRGGMGVVYEAMQLSLGRRVAVKVLPLASALDPRHLQRFRNEAHAAAQLHHNNIVPVYAVGHERAVHFYAMQLIEGRSLADLIRQLRSLSTGKDQNEQPAHSESLTLPLAHVRSEEPLTVVPGSGARPIPPGEGSGSTPVSDLSTLAKSTGARRAAFYREVAKLACQAADALDYAHHQGVVHRDIKPANLLLDNRQKLWISDFGLAQIYSDNGLTQTGDILGTFRYMSPEQASGSAVVLDQRTDVYSLGVTIYELLALKPALAGETREELLRQIESQEPPPLRSIDRNIPRELETIVHKAMVKDPADRYASAAAMAEDLRRFLADEPILARPPSIANKVARWTRRHKAAALATLAVLTVTTMASLLAAFLIAMADSATRTAYRSEQVQRTRAEQLREAAEREENRANDLRAQAEREKLSAQQQKAVAEQQRNLAEQQKRRAEQNYRQARRAVDFFTQVASEQIPKKPVFDPIKRNMLETALEYYQAFSEQNPGDVADQADLQAASQRASAILEQVAGIAQFERLNYSLELLRQTDVQNELHLTANQINQLRNYSPKPPPLPSKVTGEDTIDEPPGPGHNPMAAEGAQREASLAKLLTAPQFERLKQISRQLRGVFAFSDPDVIAALRLTPAQKQAAQSLQAGFSNMLHGPKRNPEGRSAAMKEAMNQLLGRLSSQQLKTWQSLTGSAYTGRAPTPRDSDEFSPPSFDFGPPDDDGGPGRNGPRPPPDDFGGPANPHGPPNGPPPDDHHGPGGPPPDGPPFGQP